MTPIADMIETMLAKGTPVDVILVAVRAIELSRTNVPDIQEYERTRKRAWRSKIRELPKANDVGNASEVSRTVPDIPCQLTSLSSLESQRGIREVRKKDTDGASGRAETVSRGTRLDENITLSEIDRNFALDAGIADPEKAWAEFRDYWIAVPGSRGKKLNWSATWRNRIRQIGQRGQKHGALTPSERAYRLAGKVREVEFAKGIGRPSELLRRYDPGR